MNTTRKSRAPKTARLKLDQLEGREVEVPAVVTYDVGASLSVANTFLLDLELFFDDSDSDPNGGPLSIQLDFAPSELSRQRF